MDIPDDMTVDLFGRLPVVYRDALEAALVDHMEVDVPSGTISSIIISSLIIRAEGLTMFRESEQTFKSRCTLIAIGIGIFSTEIDIDAHLRHIELARDMLGWAVLSDERNGTRIVDLIDVARRQADIERLECFGVHEAGMAN